MRYALTIRYENMQDLRKALQYQLEDLQSLETLGVEDVHIQELIEAAQRRAKEEMGLDLTLSSSPVAADPIEEETKSVESDIDPEEFKRDAIERLSKIYIKPRGAQLIDRLIKAHGGGQTLFTKIAADKFPAIMAEVIAEFPDA